MMTTVWCFSILYLIARYCVRMWVHVRDEDGERVHTEMCSFVESVLIVTIICLVIAALSGPFLTWLFFIAG